MNENLPLARSVRISGGVASARQKGFSLLEMLIAFTILAFSLVVILRIFSSGINTAIIAEEYTAAVQIAEALMAETGVVKDLQEGQVEGVESQKYSWVVSTRLYQTEVDIQPQEATDEDEDEDEERLKLYQITVSVSWGEEYNQGREVQLQTLRLALIPTP